MKSPTIILLLSLCLLFMTGCSPEENPAILRSKRANDNNGDIQVGVTFSFSSSGMLFSHGIDMALDEVNKTRGGVKIGGKTRQLVIFFKDDKRSINVGRIVAQEFVDGLIFEEEKIPPYKYINPYIKYKMTRIPKTMDSEQQLYQLAIKDLEPLTFIKIINDRHEKQLEVIKKNVLSPDEINIVAVIGNMSSYICMATSIMYEYYGILMLSPAATAPQLTRDTKDGLVFRNIVQDRETGKQMAQFALNQGSKGVMVASSRSVDGRALANEFVKKAQAIGLKVVDHRTFEEIGERVDFSKDLELWKNRTFDAVFLAGAHPEVTKITEQMRAMGFEQPVFGGDGLDVPYFFTTKGRGDTIGTVVPASFHYQKGLVNGPDGEQYTDNAIGKFVAGFKNRYHVFPDTWAAQGYDAVMLLVAAMEQADSTDPQQIARVLHTMKWDGVTGSHEFDQFGDVSKPVLKKIALSEGKGRKVSYQIYDDETRRDWLSVRRGDR